MVQHNHHFAVLIVAGILVAGSFGFLSTFMLSAIQPAYAKANLAITFAPFKPGIGEEINFGAKGYDIDGISRITVFVDGQPVSKCAYPVPKGPATDNKNKVCTYKIKYPAGSVHTFYATMLDLRGNQINEPPTGVKIFNVKDNVKPIIDYDVGPLGATITQTVSITIDVTDETRLFSASIFVDGKEVKKCSSNYKTISCKYDSKYSKGEHKYYITARDLAGNIGRVPEKGTKSFTIA